MNSKSENFDDQSEVDSLFQDERIKLTCFGHCGSKLMKFLVNETNLALYDNYKKLPRTHTLLLGSASKEFYEKLAFSSKEAEDKLFSLISNQFEIATKSVTTKPDLPVFD